MRGALRPIGRPGEIGRIDVGRQPFFAAMQLIRTDEVHLPAQDRAVAGIAQVVRHRWNGRREFAGVVVGLDGMRQPARQHRETRRRADREVVVGAVKDHRPFGQPSDMGRLDEAMAIGRQRGCGQLVGAITNKMLGASAMTRTSTLAAGFGDR